MNLKSYAFLIPVAVTVAALLGLALGPGSQATNGLGPNPIATDIEPDFTPTNTETATSVPTAMSTSTATSVPTAISTSTGTSTPSKTITPTRISTPTITATVSATRTRTATLVPTSSVPVVRVPILMYHYVSTPPPDADKYRLDLSVTPDNFQAQMDYLATNGFHPIRLADLSASLLHGVPLPDKPIVLTFDDGYTDNYENAFPILKAHNFPATFFIIAKFVEEKRWGYMSWAQLADVSKSGMEIGSHSLDHLNLRGKTKAFQTTEISGSKELLNSRLAIDVQSFCYPAGSYDANSIAVLRANNYTAAVTEIQGTRQSAGWLYELRRIRVRGSYSVAEYDHWIKWFMENGK